jgi:hypothetical protein
MANHNGSIACGWINDIQAQIRRRVGGIFGYAVNHPEELRCLKSTSGNEQSGTRRSH